jgi:osmotically-inducible protein OsmY
MKNEIQLQHDVRVQLERECHLGDDAIGVEVHHGVVRLAGSVCDCATMLRVEGAARRVEGVATVVMDIDVVCTHTVTRARRGTARLTAVS